MIKMKNKIILVCVIICMLFGTKVYALDESNSTKLLYQDATINEDGSIYVKEVVWQNGKYNGFYAKKIFSRYDVYPFTGIYSNFSGDSEIYNATGITDVKVYDISQANFLSIDDMNNKENEYKRVDSASNGKYGVYTVSNNKRSIEINVFCPSKKKKVIYREYVIHDAVVVHNDIAELYWCFLETNEKFLDYQLKVHLPKEDKNVMVWSHGPSSGYCTIDDYKTLSLKDSEVNENSYETIRIMFNKELVPNGTKKSNVDGKDYILQYENAVANPETALDEENKTEIENKLSQAFVELNKKATIYWYNIAQELIEKVKWDDSLKTEYEKKLEAFYEEANDDWKRSIEEEYNYMIQNKNFAEYKINSFISSIDKGIDENLKSEYYEKINRIQKQKKERDLKNKQKIVKTVAIVYYIFGVICILVLIKIFFEKRIYYNKYYRDFPSDDRAYIIDYLMNKKVTGKTFSAAILDLISKKKIQIEKNKDDENDYNLILKDTKSSRTMVENTVVKILFEVIGRNNICSIKSLKDFAAEPRKIDEYVYAFYEFKENVLREIYYKEYFKKDNIYTKILQKSPLIVGIICFILGLFISENGYIDILNYYGLVMILSLIDYKILALDKRRTKKGKFEYSKWLAHKRFLNDF